MSRTTIPSKRNVCQDRDEMQIACLKFSEYLAFIYPNGLENPSEDV